MTFALKQPYFVNFRRNIVPLHTKNKGISVKLVHCNLVTNLSLSLKRQNTTYNKLHEVDLLLKDRQQGAKEVYGPL
jgi:hypothetical protein